MVVFELSSKYPPLAAVYCMCLCLLYVSLSTECVYHLSHIMRKPAFCICKNKGTDQLHGNRAADQRLFLLDR